MSYHLYHSMHKGGNMGIISKRDQERIRKHQQATGETARCFYDISISRETWERIVKEYGICESPVEADADLEEFYWENPQATVRLLTKGDPRESVKSVTEVTVFARREVVDWIEGIVEVRKKE